MCDLLKIPGLLVMFNIGAGSLGPYLVEKRSTCLGCLSYAGQYGNVVTEFFL
jgi:hypothetical protein